MNPLSFAKTLVPIMQHQPILLAEDQDFSADPQTGNGEVRIGQYEFPVLDDDVNELNLARFQSKVTFGPYNLDSDPLLSSYVMSSWTGGMGNETLKEGVDDDSFWDSTLETRFPDGATLLSQTRAYAGTVTETARPVGDFPASDPVFYACFGSTLNYWDTATGAFVAAENSLTNPPSYRGVEHEDVLYIPQGASGYAMLAADGTVSEVDDTFGVIQFLVWDRKLCALTVDGELMVKPPGGDFPETAPADLVLPSGNLPRKLVNFMAQDGTPTLHIVTDSLVFAYDPDGGTSGLLYETRLDYPRHPDQGLAAINWRGDTMFVSVGLGIHSYNGTNIAGMGPDGRYGLPARLRGSIIDLEGEYNALLAMVRGISPGADPDVSQEFVVNPPMYHDRNTYQVSGLPYQPVYSSILRWSNSQWHKVWESSGATGDPTWMMVSNTATDYRLCWGYGTDIYMQDLPISYQSPKQALKIGQQPFQSTGFLITGWFDADMTAFTKLATHVEVNLEDILDNGTSGGSVAVEYQRNTGAAWNLLGVADTVGKTILPFKTITYPSGGVFSKGMDFRRIRFRFTYTQASGQVMLSPLMSSAVFKFIKVPESQLSWSFTVPLTHPDGYKGRSNRDLAKQLDEALYSSVFTTFTLGNETYRVRVAQTAGGKHTGYDHRGDFRVNLVEVTLGSTRDDTTVIKYVDQA